MDDTLSLPVRDDPLYTAGMAHLQSAEWQEAVRCFETLVARGSTEPAVLAALDQARFKARLDTQARVRPVRSTFPWPAMLARVLGAGVIIALGILGFELLIRQRIAPAVANAQRERQITQLVTTGQAHLEAWQLDPAITAFQQAQALDPENTAAAAGLAEVAKRETLQLLCQEADAHFAAGEWTAARATYTDLTVQAPGYCNATARIAEVNARLLREETWAAAEAAYAADACADAIPLYQQIQTLDMNYQAQAIQDRLYDCNMRLGRALVNAQPPAPEQIPQALAYFTEALAARPRDTEASLEQRLASLFIAGRQAYDAGNYTDAATRLNAVYDLRPTYQGTALITPLYDALIRSGDAAMASPDYLMAWQHYERACSLPGVNKVVCRGRLDTVAGLLTPTPTHSPTPTITPLPTPTPYTPPPPPATATPAPPLASLRNQIVFKSNDPEAPGFWVINPDGSRPRYLGALGDPKLAADWETLLTKERLSPDGRYRVYVTKDDGDQTPQLYIQAFEKDDFGNLTTWRVTDSSGLCYDPVWSPDSSRIAYVGTEHGSDDVWVVSPDGVNPRNLTRNNWEWDKHPSWSPDSRKIVFWSNRDGIMQIYVMDANGQNVKKLRSTSWDEYEPIWVK